MSFSMIEHNFITKKEAEEYYTKAHEHYMTEYAQAKKFAPDVYKKLEHMQQVVSSFDGAIKSLTMQIEALKQSYSQSSDGNLAKVFRDFDTKLELINKRLELLEKNNAT